jgi:Raf kinase inhibitor-like YbhB/YbcL family protein
MRLTKGTLVGVTLFAALVGCGDGKSATQERNGGPAVRTPMPARFRLSSDAFTNGEPIPVQYTCDGTDQRPPLRWGEPPPGTKSFALVMDDPDAPGGVFRHWGAYDIPASVRSLSGAQRLGKQVDNDFGKPGYGGPCPPKGHGPHHYHLKLFALHVDKLDLRADSNAADVEKTAEAHAIAQTELIGTYERR